MTSVKNPFKRLWNANECNSKSKWQSNFSDIVLCAFTGKMLDKEELCSRLITALKLTDIDTHKVF